MIHFFRVGCVHVISFPVTSFAFCRFYFHFHFPIAVSEERPNVRLNFSFVAFWNIVHGPADVWGVAAAPLLYHDNEYNFWVLLFFYLSLPICRSCHNSLMKDVIFNRQSILITLSLHHAGNAASRLLVCCPGYEKSLSAVTAISYYCLSFGHSMYSYVSIQQI